MSEEVRNRGGCLTAFLLFMMIGSPLLAAAYWLAGPTIRSANPSVPGWLIPVLALFSFYNFVFAIAMWNWRRWGVYGYTALAAALFAINLAIGLPATRAVMGLMGVAVLLLLIRPVWSQLR